MARRKITRDASSSVERSSVGNRRRRARRVTRTESESNTSTRRLTCVNYFVLLDRLLKRRNAARA